VSDETTKLRGELARRGQRRKEALASADEALREIAELLPAALEAGITKVEIQRLTGVSRPTIDALLQEDQ
jgi:hypothetical protein